MENLHSKAVSRAVAYLSKKRAERKAMYDREAMYVYVSAIISCFILTFLAGRSYEYSVDIEYRDRVAEYKKMEIAISELKAVKNRNIPVKK